MMSDAKACEEISPFMNEEGGGEGTGKRESWAEEIS